MYHVDLTIITSLLKDKRIRITEVVLLSTTIHVYRYSTPPISPDLGRNRADVRSCPRPDLVNR